MKTKGAIQIVLILGVVVLAASSQAQGTQLYDNGPIGGGASYNIDTVSLSPAQSDTFQVADNFTLTAASTLQSATIGVWTSPGDPLTGVSWSITSTPFPGTAPLFGGGSSTTDTALFQNSAGDTVSSDSFQFGSIELPAGTYWLQLNSPITQNAGIYGSASWDVSGGPSSAVEAIIIFNGGRPTSESTYSIGSESFQLYGTVTSAPEPSTMALAMIGGLSLICLRRRIASAVPPTV